ncbi:hypothetical protein EA74_02367 [Enterococcus hirae]|uniref:hypothetical protein n=1 Tax=Enterococcus hirae TaxID=1354 RepID=UPI000DE93582|nr:hypothetical protein [Enterococcus hirae]RBT48109.1 hypothetical protein EA74_02367 [Enterococcus hirae]
MKGYIVGIGLSMALSIWCLVEVCLNYGSLKSAILAIAILVPGLIGLYFSTKVKNKKIRWILLVINYLLATLFNFFQFLNQLVQLFQQLTGK